LDQTNEANGRFSSLGRHGVPAYKMCISQREGFEPCTEVPGWRTNACETVCVSNFFS